MRDAFADPFALLISFIYRMLLRKSGADDLISAALWHTLALALVSAAQ
jgi:hypothetical protein